MYHFAFYVPVSHAKEVKQSVFAAGAGTIGNYQQCCWQVMGQGQFFPIAGSNPTIGQQDKLEVVEELKIEMVVADELVEPVLKALKQAHPYEEPAYYFIKLADK